MAKEISDVMADEIETEESGGDADQEAMMAEWEAMADDDGDSNDGAGAYFAGLLNPLLGIAEEGATEELAEVPSGPAVYFEIPEMLVNLNSTGRKTGYLKISISLELGSEEDIVLLEGVMPRVVDGFQVYLRELRVEDLQGSAGLQRLREELLLRVASAANPAQIKDVLFREMLIQ